MKKRRLLILSIILGLFFVNSILAIQLPRCTANSQFDDSDKSLLEFVITEGGLDYHPEASQSLINQPFKMYHFLDQNGREITAETVLDKPSLFYFVEEGSTAFQLYYPQLIEWAKRYKDSLNIVLYFEKEPSTTVAKRLNEAGIIYASRAAIPYNNPERRSFLVNSDGKIVEYFYFHPIKLTRLNQLIDTFAKTGKIPDSLFKRSFLSENDLAPNIQLTHSINKDTPLTLDALKGKPSIFFIGSFQFWDVMIPVIQKLEQEYADTINLVFIAELPPSQEQINIQNQYYQQHSITNATTMVNDYPAESINQYFAELELDTPIYTDYSQIDRRWDLISSLTIIVLDQENHLQKYYPAHVGYGEGLLLVEDLIEQDILASLEN